MSRSKRAPIVKDKGFGNKLYRRVTRRSVKNSIKSNITKLIDDEDCNIKDPKNVINDWDRSDYTFDHRFDLEDNEYKEKLKRK